MSISPLSKIKNIILVASGKGGVGKSTVATNLCIALDNQGKKTGILDADIYGPSIPIIFGVENYTPTIFKEENKELLEPANVNGIQVMSLGFLMKPDDAVIWRGPMASNTLTQLLEQSKWDDLDYLVIDMPPGTGDIAITLAQKVPRARAIIVVTPQKFAIADGRKALKMFSSKNVNIPILGVVENMAYFIPEPHPNEKYYVFGNGGGTLLANEQNTEMLAQIPLMLNIGEYTNSGNIDMNNYAAPIIDLFNNLAMKVMNKIDNFKITIDSKKLLI